MDADSQFLLEIQKSFLEEVSELLEKTERCYLELEKNPKSASLLEEIFRCVHTIKGGAAGVNFNDLSRFSHTVENLLVSLKNNELSINSEIVSILLESNDRFNTYIAALRKDSHAKIKTDDIAVLIKKTLQPSNPGLKTPKPENKKLKESSEKEKSDPSTDSSHKKLGEILVEQGVITEEKLKKALQIQRQQKKVSASNEDSYIRLPLSKIDNMLDYFGEQVILQSALEYSRHDLTKNQDLIEKTILQLNKITYDLQQTAISLRMVSLKNLFSRARRIVRDTSIQIGKKIDLKTEGEEKELDKIIMDELSGPLSHLLRNSADHGIEDPKIRKKNKKPEAGTITLRAYHKGGFFYLEVSDDGKGLDSETIRKKALEKNLIKENQPIDENDLFQLIMKSGFSTKKEASDISGRGVGLDVVKTSIDKLHGSIQVSSTPNKGSCFTIRLPLTLSLFNGFIVNIWDKKYIFPNSEIKEVCHINLKEARDLNKKEKVIEVKNSVIPIIDIRNLLLNSPKPLIKDKKEVMMIVSKNGRDFALLVDDILSQQKIVLKKLGREVENIPAIAGGTILGDGKVALIVEVNELVSLYQETLNNIA